MQACFFRRGGRPPRTLRRSSGGAPRPAPGAAPRQWRPPRPPRRPLPARRRQGPNSGTTAPSTTSTRTRSGGTEPNPCPTVMRYAPSPRPLGAGRVYPRLERAVGARGDRRVVHDGPAGRHGAHRDGHLWVVRLALHDDDGHAGAAGHDDVGARDKRPRRIEQARRLVRVGGRRQRRAAELAGAATRPPRTYSGYPSRYRVPGWPTVSAYVPSAGRGSPHAPPPTGTSITTAPDPSGMASRRATTVPSPPGASIAACTALSTTSVVPTMTIDCAESESSASTMASMIFHLSPMFMMREDAGGCPPSGPAAAAAAGGRPACTAPSRTSTTAMSTNRSAFPALP